MRNVISFARFVITNSFSALSICQEFKYLFGERQLINIRFSQLKAIFSEQYNKFATVHRLDITYLIYCCNNISDDVTSLSF